VFGSAAKISDYFLLCCLKCVVASAPRLGYYLINFPIKTHLSKTKYKIIFPLEQKRQLKLRGVFIVLCFTLNCHFKVNWGCGSAQSTKCCRATQGKRSRQFLTPFPFILPDIIPDLTEGFHEVLRGITNKIVIVASGPTTNFSLTFKRVLNVNFV
jgi:hypothetical protein